jgi:hypothetical protein
LVEVESTVASAATERTIAGQTESTTRVIFQSLVKPPTTPVTAAPSATKML